MKKVLIRVTVGVASLFLAALIVHSFVPGTSPSLASTQIKPASAVALASPGRIEGASDSISVGAAADGVVRSIYVKEGQKVNRGDVLAAINCEDLESALRVAKAESESLKQQRARLVHGSRDEERQAAAQKTLAAKAIQDQARTQLERMQKLSDAQAISKAAYDEARRDAEVAEASYKAAMRNEELVNAAPLREDLQRANADVLAADERIQFAQEKLGKCVVRAPISGSILRIHMREGESFTTLAPRPLLSMADLSGRRVRAEVDERDLGKLRVGQTIRITAVGSNQQFSGTVTQLASVMGRKSIQTGDPADKQDRDVLEAVAKLEPDASVLPVGLRVTVQFVP